LSKAEAICIKNENIQDTSQEKVRRFCQIRDDSSEYISRSL
jgi:hypothetical protein